METEPTLPARSVLGLIMELRDMPAVDDLVLSIAKRPDQVRGGVGGAVHEHTARPGEGGRGGGGGAVHEHTARPGEICLLAPLYCVLAPRYCLLAPRYLLLAPRYCLLAPRY